MEPSRAFHRTERASAAGVRDLQGGTVDRQLVVLAREGDHDAFARLAAASIGRLNAIARLILHDYGAAEDAVQDALVDAWRDLRGLRDPDRFDPWVTRILVRHCQDHRRRVRRRGLVELPWLMDDGPASDDTQANLAVADQLERGLQRLTTEQRTSPRPLLLPRPALGRGGRDARDPHRHHEVAAQPIARRAPSGARRGRAAARQPPGAAGMTAHGDLEQQLHAHFAAQADRTVLEGQLDSIAAEAAAVRQRRTWLAAIAAAEPVRSPGSRYQSPRSRGCPCSSPQPC